MAVVLMVSCWFTLPQSCPRYVSRLQRVGNRVVTSLSRRGPFRLDDSNHNQRYSALCSTSALTTAIACRIYLHLPPERFPAEESYIRLTVSVVFVRCTRGLPAIAPFPAYHGW
ncbi:hypothetical protein BDW68DRAFT_171509 [Aspergillus falconensis]